MPEMIVLCNIFLVTSVVYVLESTNGRIYKKNYISRIICSIISKSLAIKLLLVIKQHDNRLMDDRFKSLKSHTVRPPRHPLNNKSYISLNEPQSTLQSLPEISVGDYGGIEWPFPYFNCRPL